MATTVTCPICGETSAADLAAAETLTCPRCGTTFDQRAATVVDPSVARRSFAESVRATETAAGATPATAAAVNAAAWTDLPSIPGYEVTGFIARGGMGVVLKARHAALGRWAAIKMPIERELIGGEGRERFLREARSAGGLRHPNICPIYEVGETPHGPFIAMAFIEGQTLRDWVKEREPSPHEVAGMVGTLARAVAYAHEHGVVHRDIKPANVMVTAETSEPVLTDFGLAKEMTVAGAEATATGSVAGTPAYMAPEQVAGLAGEIGPRTDVYALGAVLYELLCGRPPFLGTRAQVLWKVLSAEPAAPRKHNPRVHRDLETICLKALAKDPAARYVTALALAEDLDRFRSGEAILARREPMPARLWRKVRRHRWEAGAALVGVLLVVVLLYLFFRVRRTTEVSNLAQAVRDGVAAGDWSEAHVESLEAAIGKLALLSPEEGERARGRLVEGFAGAIREAIGGPSLAPEEIARIEGDIERLSTRSSAQAMALRVALQERLRSWQPIFALGAPFHDPPRVFSPQSVDVQEGKALVRAQDPKGVLPVLLSSASCEGSVQLEAVFTRSWQGASELGLVLSASGSNPGYSFLLRLPGLERSAAEGSGAAAKLKTFAEVREARGSLRVQLSRRGVTLRGRVVPASEVPDGPLRLVAQREGNSLTFRVNNLPPLTFDDPFPLGRADAGFFGVVWPVGVAAERLRAARQDLPVAPSPLERGDDLYARGSAREALAFYREQALVPELLWEARYKEGLCLLELKRADEALGVFQKVAAQKGGRWPDLAACQLWLDCLRKGQINEADAIFERLSPRYRLEELIAAIPENMGIRYVSALSGSTHHATLLDYDPRRVEHCERALELADILDVDIWTIRGARRTLFKAYFLTNQLEKATTVAEQYLQRRFYHSDVTVCLELAWVLRQRGQADRAIEAINRYLLNESGLVNLHHCGMLVERARAYIDLGRWKDAERDIAWYFSAGDPEKDGYQPHSCACLVQGFLRERRGDAAGALESWRRAVFKADESGKLTKTTYLAGIGSGSDLHRYWMAASLVGDLPEAEVDTLVAKLIGFDRNHSAVALVKAFGLSPTVYQAVRDTWRGPRGHECARKVAFLQVSFMDFLRLPVALCTMEIIRKDAFGGTMTADQDALAWQLALDFCAAYSGGKLSKAQGPQIMLAWKGVTNLFGWAGLASSLDPALRGQMAYVLAHRYLRLKQPDDARALFRSALADAAPGSLLQRLAEADLKGLEAK